MAASLSLTLSLWGAKRACGLACGAAPHVGILPGGRAWNFAGALQASEGEAEELVDVFAASFAVLDRSGAEGPAGSASSTAAGAPPAAKASAAEPSPAVGPLGDAGLGQLDLGRDGNTRLYVVWRICGPTPLEWSGIHVGQGLSAHDGLVRLAGGALGRLMWRRAYSLDEAMQLYHSRAELPTPPLLFQWQCH